MRIGSGPRAPNSTTLPPQRSWRLGLNKPFFLLVLTGIHPAAWWVQAQSGVQVGYVNMTAAPGENAVTGTALFSFSNPDGVLVSEAAVPASRPIRNGRALVDEKGTRTAVALANPGPEPATISLSLRDRRGEALGTRFVSLGAGEQRSSFVAELFGELPGKPCFRERPSSGRGDLERGDERVWRTALFDCSGHRRIPGAVSDPADCASPGGGSGLRHPAPACQRWRGCVTREHSPDRTGRSAASPTGRWGG